MDTIILTGNTPSKKNSKRIFVNKRTGKPFITSSESHGLWYSGASFEVKSWKNKLTAAQRSKLPLKDAYLEIEVFPPTASKGDLTNKAESVMDLLVDMQVLQDDNWTVVPELRLKFGGIDRHNPRAEIFLVDNTV